MQDISEKFQTKMENEKLGGFRRLRTEKLNYRTVQNIWQVMTGKSEIVLESLLNFSFLTYATYNVFVLSFQIIY